MIEHTWETGCPKAGTACRFTCRQFYSLYMRLIFCVLFRDSTPPCCGQNQMKHLFHIAKQKTSYFRYRLRPSIASAGRQEVRECIDIAAIPDIAADELDPAVNVGVLFAADQGSHGFGGSVFCPGYTKSNANALHSTNVPTPHSRFMRHHSARFYPCPSICRIVS